MVKYIPAKKKHHRFQPKGKQKWGRYFSWKLKNILAFQVSQTQGIWGYGFYHEKNECEIFPHSDIYSFILLRFTKSKCLISDTFLMRCRHTLTFEIHMPLLRKQQMNFREIIIFIMHSLHQLFFSVLLFSTHHIDIDILMFWKMFLLHLVNICKHPRSLWCVWWLVFFIKAS